MTGTTKQTPKPIKLHRPLSSSAVRAISTNTLSPVLPALADYQEKRARDEAISTAVPGQMIPGEGIFFGQYAPRDRDGNSLGKVFNAFAAPADLTQEQPQKSLFTKILGLFSRSRARDTFTYTDAVTRIANLKNWHGFDGAGYANDAELYAALKDSSYKGEWVIPPSDLLQGIDLNGNKSQPDNLLTHKNKGALAGTFSMAAASGSDFPVWYWSSTEHREFPSDVWFVRLSAGYGGWVRKDYGRLSCRPVRLVEDAKRSASHASGPVASSGRRP